MVVIAATCVNLVSAEFAFVREHLPDRFLGSERRAGNMQKLSVILTKLGILVGQLEFSYQLSVISRGSDYRKLKTENCKLKIVQSGGLKDV